MGNTTSTTHPLAIALAAVLGVLVGVVLGIVWVRRTIAGTAPVAIRAPGTRPGDADLLTYVPDGVRFVGEADVAAVRGASWFQTLAGRASTPGSCEDRLLQRVRRAAVLIDGAGFDRFAMVFRGPMTREELLACAAARREGSTGRAVRDHVAGGDRVRWLPPSDPNLLPPVSTSEIVYLDGGVVLAGTSELVERMLDRARMEPRERPAVIDAMVRRLGSTPSAWGAFVGRPSQLDDVPSMRHVTGIAVGLTFGDPISGVIDVACDDYDAPRAVADDLATLAARLRDTLEALPHVAAVPLFATALRDARIERGAADVHVRFALTTETWTALVTMASELLAPSAPTSPPSRTPSLAAPTDAGAP